MTLCGVLKNILLVIASVLIFSTIVTWLQVFGYGIATAGLVYYGVGYEGIQTSWEFAQNYAKKLWKGDQDTAITQRPALLRKALIITMYATVVVLLVVGIASQTSTGSELMQDLTERLPSPQ